MTKWKLVPGFYIVGVVTGEMTAAVIATTVANTGNDAMDRTEDYKQVLLSMLEAAPQPPKSEPIAYIEHHKGGDNLVWDNPGGKYSVLYTAPLVTKLSDERILELWRQHEGEDEVYGFARAIERELLGE